MNIKKRKPRQSQPKSKLCVLRQVCELIPSHLVAKLATKHKVKSRDIIPWSHVVAMLFAQLSAAISLNDVCDNLRNHLGRLSTIRGAKPWRLPRFCKIATRWTSNNFEIGVATGSPNTKSPSSFSSLTRCLATPWAK